MKCLPENFAIVCDGNKMPKDGDWNKATMGTELTENMQINLCTSPEERQKEVSGEEVTLLFH